MKDENLIRFWDQVGACSAASLRLSSKGLLVLLGLRKLPFTGAHRVEEVTGAFPR